MISFWIYTESIGPLSADVQIQPVPCFCRHKTPRCSLRGLTIIRGCRSEDSSGVPIRDVTIAGGVGHHLCFERFFR